MLISPHWLAVSPLLTTLSPYFSMAAPLPGLHEDQAPWGNFRQELSSKVHFCVMPSAPFHNCFFLSVFASSHVKCTWRKTGVFRHDFIKVPFLHRSEADKSPLSKPATPSHLTGTTHTAFSSSLSIFQFGIIIYTWLLIISTFKRKQCSPWLLVWNAIRPSVLAQHLPSGGPLAGLWAARLFN